MYTLTLITLKEKEKGLKTAQWGRVGQEFKKQKCLKASGHLGPKHPVRWGLVVALMFLGIEILQITYIVTSKII